MNRRFFFCALALTIVCSLGVQSHAVIVAHYTFDETSGQTANDTGGVTAENLVTTNGGVGWTDGLIGGAVNLTADVMLASSELVDGDDFTLMAWINEASGQGGYRGIFVTGANTVDGGGGGGDIPGGGTDNWGLNVEGSRQADIRVSNNGGGSQGLDMPGVVQGEWQHFALTYTGDGVNATAKAYLNGSLVVTKTQSNNIERDFTAGSQLWQLGTDRDNDGRRFTGLVDDLGVWNEVLPDSEIERIYNNGLAGFPLTETGTIVPGDVNGDTFVDNLDFDTIRTNFLQEFDDRMDGDLVDNGVVDFADYAQWKQATKTSPPALGGSSAGVPEPTSVALVLAACVAGFCLRQRSK